MPGGRVARAVAGFRCVVKHSTEIKCPIEFQTVVELMAHYEQLKTFTFHCVQCNAAFQYLDLKAFDGSHRCLQCSSPNANRKPRLPTAGRRPLSGEGYNDSARDRHVDGEEYDVGALEFRALPSQPTRELINNEVLETLTQPVLSCAVCDWLLLCTDPKPRHVTLAEVPSRHLLKPPPELPPLLKAQYCPHPQLDGFMFGWRGVTLPPAGSDAEVTLNVCVRCWQALKKCSLPRNAIANGLFIGELPEFKDKDGKKRLPQKVEVSLVSKGLRMSSIVTLTARGPAAQRQIRGHVYTQKINVQKVVDATLLPLKPADVPLRVLVLSSFTPLERIANLDGFEVDREVVTELLRFFIRHNELYSDVKIDADQLNALPQKGIIPSMVQTVSEEEMDGVAHDHPVAQARNRVPGADSGDGHHNDAAPMFGASSVQSGPSDEKSSGSADSAVAGSASAGYAVWTSSISVERRNEVDFEGTANALDSLSQPNARSKKSNEHQSLGERDQKNDPASGTAAATATAATATSATGPLSRFEVKASSDPLWDSDPNWLVLAFPDLFPFGRGGRNEKRKVRLSVNDLFEHCVRLSSRRFQRPDFVLHAYDVKAQQKIRSQAFVTAKATLARRRLFDEGDDADDPASGKNDCFGVFSATELTQASQHQRDVADAIRFNCPVPLPPPGLSQPASSFINTVRRSVGLAEHTPEYGIRMRARLFGYSNELGPATWWLTIAPDDLLSVRLFEFATATRPLSAPLAQVRLCTVASSPGAAALSFLERQILVVQKIIGWDMASGKAYRKVASGQSDAPSEAGGMFGPCRAFTMAIESQARGSLHMHCLVWTHTRSIEAVRKNLQRYAAEHEAAAVSEPAQAPSSEAMPQAPAVGATSSSAPVVATEMSQSALEPAVAVRRAETQLSALLSGGYRCGLSLKPEQLNCFTACPKSGCSGELRLRQKLLLELRKKGNESKADSMLRCNSCKSTTKPHTHIQHAFNTLFASYKTAYPDADQLKWSLQLYGAKAWSSDANTKQLQFAVLQYGCNAHRHFPTCFKKKSSPGCRFNFPFRNITHSFATLRPTGGKVEVGVRREPPFCWMNQHSPELFGSMLCNTNLQFVKNQTVTYYITMYQSKQSREEQRANEAMITAFKRNLERNRKEPIRLSASIHGPEHQETDAERQDRRQFSIGVGSLLAGTRAFTSTDAVSAQAAAFYLIGGTSYLCSHPVSYLPTAQGIAFLEEKEVSFGVGRGGRLYNTVMDYVYRPSDPEFAAMSWYRYVKYYETKLKSRSGGSTKAAAKRKAQAQARHQQHSDANDAAFEGADRDDSDGDAEADTLKILESDDDHQSDEKRYRVYNANGPSDRDQTAAESTESTSVAQSVSLDSPDSGAAHERSAARPVQGGVKRRRRDSFGKQKAMPAAKRKRVSTAGRGKQPAYDFDPFNPRATTHHVVKRVRETIVALLGKRLESESRLNAPAFENSPEREQFATSALVLFVPFRSLADLKGPTESFWAAWQRLRARAYADPLGGAVLHNLQAVHSSQEYVDVANAEVHTDMPTDPQGSGEVFPDSDEEYGIDVMQTDHLNVLDVEEPGASGAAGETGDDEIPANAPVDKIVGVLAQFGISITKRIDTPEEVSLEAAALSLETFTERGKATAARGTANDTDGSKSATEPTHMPSVSMERPTTVIERVALACEQLSFSADHLRVDPLNRRVPAVLGVDFPTIKAASLHWTLNERQHYAFVLLATSILDAVLHSIGGQRPEASAQHELDQARMRLRTITAPLQAANEPDDVVIGRAFGESDEPVLERGIFGFVTGSAGTGKSRVIDATVDFARRWAADDTLKVCATSGAAAALIRASTWESAMGVSRGIGMDDAMAPPPPHQMKQWSSIGVVIIDEIGMAGSRSLRIMDQRLRQLKSCPAVLFGGLHFIVFGDFRQIPPVMDKPVYNIADHAKVGDQLAARQRDGHELWMKQLRVGVELVTNERARTDGVYADMLERFSVNQPTADDLKRINERVVQPLGSNGLQLPVTALHILVPGNKARAAINYHRFAEYCRANPTSPEHVWRQRGAIRIDATLTCATGSGELTDRMKTIIRRTRLNGASRTDSGKAAGKADDIPLLCGELNCVLGGSFMVLSNEQTRSGIVNGTLCTLIDVVVKEGATVRFTSALPLEGGGTHYIEARHVLAIVLRYHDPAWAALALFPDLPVGCFPLFLRKSYKIVVAPKTIGVHRQVQVRQFSLTPAHALTGHKAQGATLSKVLVAQWKAAAKFNVGRDGWIYTMLSRVRSINDLFVVTPLPTDPERFPPRIDLINEFARLRRVCFQPTLERLQRFDAVSGSAAQSAFLAVDSAADAGSASTSTAAVASLDSRAGVEVVTMPAARVAHEGTDGHVNPSQEHMDHKHLPTRQPFAVSETSISLRTYTLAPAAPAVTQPPEPPRPDVFRSDPLAIFEMPLILMALNLNGCDGIDPKQLHGFGGTDVWNAPLATDDEFTVIAYSLALAAEPVIGPSKALEFLNDNTIGERPTDAPNTMFPRCWRVYIEKRDRKRVLDFLKAKEPIHAKLWAKHVKRWRKEEWLPPYALGLNLL